MRTGIRFVIGSAVVRPTLLATATINFFNFVFWALCVLYVTSSAGVGRGALGPVAGIGAVGGLIGSRFAARCGRPRGTPTRRTV